MLSIPGVFTNHCFREANKVADKMASLGHNRNQLHIYTLPSQLKGLLNTDKQQIPSFRIKKRKPAMIVYEPLEVFTWC